MNGRRFYVLWIGQLLSGLGSGMTGFALGIHVFQRTGRVSDFSYVILALFVPSILLKPIGGILADAIDRRLLMVLSDLAAFLNVLALVLFVPVHTAATGTIYLIVAIGSALSSLRDPAYKASITDLLGVEGYARAGGMVQLAASAQHVLSPVIAGALIAVGALSVVLIVDAVTFGIAVVSTCVVVVMSRSVRTSTKSVRPHRANGTFIFEGLGAVVGDGTVRAVVAVISATTFFVGLLQTLLHPMLLYRTTADNVGMVQSVAAVGMITSSLVLGTVTVTDRYDRMLRFGLVAAGSGMALLGFTPYLVVTGFGLFVLYGALPFINTGADVLIRSRIPNDRQGRVWGVVGLLSQCGYLLAYLSAGVLADRVFEPLLRRSGGLARTVGTVIGVGSGRGIGLMIVLSGIALVTLSLGGRTISQSTRNQNALRVNQEDRSL